MPYTQHLADIGYYGSGFTNHQIQGLGDQTFPGTFQYALLSFWFDTSPQASFSVQCVTFADFHTQGFEAAYIKSTNSIEVTVGDGLDHGGQPFIGDLVFPVSPTFGSTLTHVLVSIDSVNQIVQCYINDASVAPDTSTWAAAAEMASSFGIPGLVTGGRASGGDGCIGDVWAGHTSSFFDLSVSANRRKFIDGSGNPVDLGASGSLPTGSSPEIYLSVYGTTTASDILTNRGTGGQNFQIPFPMTQDPLKLCGLLPALVVTEEHLIVVRDSSACIFNNRLHATGGDSVAANMVYTVGTPPAHGALKRSGTPVSSFTQADIDAGLVTYTQDGSSTTSDSFVFTVQEAVTLPTANTTFHIDIVDRGFSVGSAVGVSDIACVGAASESACVGAMCETTTVSGGTKRC